MPIFRIMGGNSSSRSNNNLTQQNNNQNPQQQQQQQQTQRTSRHTYPGQRLGAASSTSFPSAQMPSFAGSLPTHPARSGTGGGSSMARNAANVALSQGHNHTIIRGANVAASGAPSETTRPGAYAVTRTTTGPAQV